MKVFRIIQTTYIAIVSSLLVVSSYQGAFRWLFTSERCYAIHFYTGIILIIMAIFIIIAHFKIKSLVSLLQILWWIPQLLTVKIKVISQDFSSMKVYSLYYWPFPLNLSFELFKQLNHNRYLAVGLNFIPLIAILLTLFFMRRSKKRSHIKKINYDGIEAS